MKAASLLHWTSLLLANTGGRPPLIASRQGQSGPEQFKHDDWRALVTRFVSDGEVDYPGLLRVHRLVEAYLDRLSHGTPDSFAHADEQLAFYLNAFNAIAVHQALQRYPIVSFREIPTAWTRPYPVGRENLSLHELLHGKIRAFGDPRVHAAVVPAAVSAPGLRGYSAAGLQQELDKQMRALLADPAKGLRVGQDAETVALSRLFHWFAGDFAGGAPGPRTTLHGLLQPSIALPVILRYAPPGAAELLHARRARVTFLPYDWRLNGPRKRGL